MVMAVELGLEGEEAAQIAAFGVESGLGLAGHFGDEVEVGQVGQLVFGGLNGR
jgi:hypothetical protein